MEELVIRLSEKDVLNLKQILLDNDEPEALRFLKENCEPLIKKQERPHCGPSFEKN